MDGDLSSFATGFANADDVDIASSPSAVTSSTLNATASSSVPSTPGRRTAGSRVTPLGTSSSSDTGHIFVVGSSETDQATGTGTAREATSSAPPTLVMNTTGDIGTTKLAFSESVCQSNGSHREPCVYFVCLVWSVCPCVCLCLCICVSVPACLPCLSVCLSAAPLM